ncbi:MAG: hypothetical protein NTV60_01405 [Candidatus Kaiserbacteria bacterium]|nr:hypothetical protein [Candidatus Kaiserbacteria bacterium]
MTKRYPVPYFVKKTLAKPADASVWAKDSKEIPAKREEILAAIKKRVLAKKKKK